VILSAAFSVGIEPTFYRNVAEPNRKQPTA